MLLHDLLDAAEVLEVVHDAPIAVTDVIHDHRAASPGALFCCVVGARSDGHDFAAAAVDRGAVALLVEHGVAPAVPQARVRSVRTALGPVAARFHGDPSRSLTMLGVTGTNGKTTTTFLLERIALAAHHAPARLGTLGASFAGVTAPATFTTPEATDLQRTLAVLRRDGADVVVMEVSSHALSQHRVDGTHFAVVGFTNLTREHLDHHHTMDDYFAAKARLFTREFADDAAINVDDSYGAVLVDLAKDAGLAVTTFGTDPAATVRAEAIEVGADGSRFRLRVPGESLDVRVALPGRFNVENALAAAAMATVAGIDPAAIATGLAEPGGVPGRFEVVRSAPVTVVVDYAHTPEGIATVLRAARELGRGRVVAVFGCGGDRDAEKRPAMGAAAGRGADLVVLTTDNARSEDPAAIAAAAEVGLRDVGARYTVELDRRTAIRTALAAASPGDTVLVLGKGAEPGQILGVTHLDFDDRVVAAEELEAVWT